MIPTLLGIMVINFIVIQAAPGGPVEQTIAKLRGTAIDSTARVSGGGGGEVLGSSQAPTITGDACQQVSRRARARSEIHQGDRAHVRLRQADARTLPA